MHPLGRDKPDQINMLTLYPEPTLLLLGLFLYVVTNLWLSTVGGEKWLITMATVCAVLLQL